MIGSSALRAVSQERVTVDNTSGGVKLTRARFTGAPHVFTALVTVETATIRYLTDGTAPTATAGTIAYPGDKIELNNPSELYNFLAIRTGTTSATIQVIYFGR